MNTLEHHIISILSETNITKEYNENMKRFYPEYINNEEMYRVVLRVNCYGVDEVKTEIWSKSNLEKYKKQGYYLA